MEMGRAWLSSSKRKIDTIVLKPLIGLGEGDVVAHSGAAAAEEHIGVREDDGEIVVDDVQDGVVASVELDSRSLLPPVPAASDIQIGVAAREGSVTVGSAECRWRWRDGKDRRY